MKKKSSVSASVAADSRRLLRFLAKNRSRLSPLLVLTHDFPDPDSIASAFALKVLAEAEGISCRIAYGGVIGRTENQSMVSLLRVPIRRLRPGELARHENVALVDTQPSFRNNRFPPNRRAAIVIDQHRSTVTPDADLSIVNTHCGATSVILANALLSVHRRPPTPVATALAYGILTDTMHFFRSGERIVTESYLDLLPHCDLTLLAKIQNPKRSRRFFATLARGIRRAVVCGPVLVSHLGNVETPDLVSQTADFFLSYERVRWAFSTGRYRGRLCLSLRTSKVGAEAGEILRDVCGDRASAGGHGSIAGGSMDVGREIPEAGWRNQENALLVRLLERLEVSRRNAIAFPFQDGD